MNPSPPLSPKSYPLNPFHHLYFLWALATLLLAVLVIPAFITYSLNLRTRNNSLVPPKTSSQSCGGWDTSGEIICECSGNLVKNACSPGNICDSGQYQCDGQCGSCCYNGIAENPNHPKCNPATSSTSPILKDWKTYINTKYQYSLKYPQDNNLKQFTCGEKFNEVGGDETFALEQSKVLPPCSGHEWYYTFELNVEEGDQISVYESLSPNWQVEVQGIIIDGVPGMLYKVLFLPKTTAIGYPNYFEARVFNNNKTYIFTISSESDKELLDQILSTFRFLDNE